MLVHMYSESLLGNHPSRKLKKVGNERVVAQRRLHCIGILEKLNFLASEGGLEWRGGQVDRLPKGDPIGWIRFIRSFVCNTKRPSVKQSMKWQVSSNFQIYLGKTDDRPPSQTLPDQRMNFFAFQLYWVKLTIDRPGIRLKQKLYMVYSFTFYPALLSSLIFCHLELSNWTGQSCIYFYRKFLSISLWLLYYVVVVYYTTTTTCCCCCVLHNNNNNYKIHINSLWHLC